MGDDAFDDSAFEAWLAGDPRRQAAFDTMWRRVMGSDMDAALRVLDRRIASKGTWLASGAAAMLALAGVYEAIPLAELQLARPARYTVSGETVRKIRLADGTQLTLAGGADVEVRYTRHYRVVALARGTIFADVAHDERRPFRVDTGGARIVDVGTSFEILSKAESVRVTVASGTVRFGTDDWFSKPISLTATQAAVLDQKGLTRTTNVNPARVASWRTEWVEYKGARLREVIADLQSLSPMPIKIADDGLAERPVSGRIRLTDPIGQLQNLSIIQGFHVRNTGGSLVISDN